MVRDASVELIVKYLNDSGYTANHIPESPNKKRADIFATHDQFGFLIEVKDKASFKPKLEREIQRGNVVAVMESEDYAYRNGIDSIITTAARQLRSTISDYKEFQLLWINPECVDMEVLWYQIMFTWYGIEWIGSPDNENGQNDICFYFTYSSSFKNQNVVAIIMPNDDSEPVIYLNKFCPELGPEYCSSALARVFANPNF